jgi:hypothetical protein
MARLLLSLLVGLWGLGLLLQPAPALAYDNPDLLPDHPTPVIDLAKALTDSQRQGLEEQLNQFEASSGWKLRVLTQYDRTPGQAVKQYWDLDERSLLLVADPRGGNLLNFNVGDALFALMPRTYWVELQTRYGNQYYVAEHGEDGAIVGALGAVLDEHTIWESIRSETFAALGWQSDFVPTREADLDEKMMMVTLFKVRIEGTQLDTKSTYCVCSVLNYLYPK